MSEPNMFKWLCSGCELAFNAELPEHGRPDCPECHSTDTGDGVPVSEVSEDDDD